ncbi:hypothetical protein FOL47_004789, partial [Perkinsus chesapeaki]
MTLTRTVAGLVFSLYCSSASFEETLWCHIMSTTSPVLCAVAPPPGDATDAPIDRLLLHRPKDRSTTNCKVSHIGGYKYKAESSNCFYYTNQANKDNEFVFDHERNLIVDSITYPTERIKALEDNCEHWKKFTKAEAKQDRVTSSNKPKITVLNPKDESGVLWVQDNGYWGRLDRSSTTEMGYKTLESSGNVIFAPVYTEAREPRTIGIVKTNAVRNTTGASHEYAFLRRETNRAKVDEV